MYVYIFRNAHKYTHICVCVGMFTYNTHVTYVVHMFKNSLFSEKYLLEFLSIYLLEKIYFNS